MHGALRVVVTGVAGSTRSARLRSGSFVYESYDALLADDRVDVVHLTTPNHLHHEQVKRALDAGKHVVREAARVDLRSVAGAAPAGAASGLVHCTNFNIGSTRSCRRKARARPGRRARPAVERARRLPAGLALPTDWNWRLEV